MDFVQFVLLILWADVSTSFGSVLTGLIVSMIYNNSIAETFSVMLFMKSSITNNIFLLFEIQLPHYVMSQYRYEIILHIALCCIYKYDLLDCCHIPICNHHHHLYYTLKAE